MLRGLPLLHVQIPVSTISPPKMIDELCPLGVIGQPQSPVVSVGPKHDPTIGIHGHGDLAVAPLNRSVSGQVCEVRYR